MAVKTIPKLFNLIIFLMKIHPKVISSTSVLKKYAILYLKDIMVPYLPMDKLALEKLIQC